MNKAQKENIAVLVFLISIIVVIILFFVYDYCSKKNIADTQVTTTINYKHWEKAPEDIPDDVKKNLQEAIDEDFKAKSIVIN